MDILQQQITNEYAHSNTHTTATIRAEIEDDMGSYVDDFIKDLRKHFSETDFSYTLKSGEKKIWQTKADRYADMQELDDDDWERIGWATVVACIQQERTTFAAIVGRIRGMMPHELRAGMETASEIIGVLNNTPFIEVIYPRYSDDGMMQVESCLDLDYTTIKYIEDKRFVLPSLVLPPEIVSNTETGYQTIAGSIFTKGKHHAKTVNLRHINRLNAIPLTLDESTYLNTEPVYKASDKEDVDPKEHYEDWKTHIKNSLGVFAYLSGKRFYFTHKFDERLRTYSQGHELNLQGSDYHRAGIELAEKELVL